MSQKGFNKKLQHRCEYCVFGNEIPNSNEIICKKKGVTDRQDSCRHYKYDPLKRNPEQTKISNNYSPEDFLI